MLSSRVGPDTATDAILSGICLPVQDKRANLTALPNGSATGLENDIRSGLSKVPGKSTVEGPSLKMQDSRTQFDDSKDPKADFDSARPQKRHLNSSSPPSSKRNPKRRNTTATSNVADEGGEYGPGMRRWIASSPVSAVTDSNVLRDQLRRSGLPTDPPSIANTGAPSDSYPSLRGDTAPAGLSDQSHKTESTSLTVLPSGFMDETQKLENHLKEARKFLDVQFNIGNAVLEKLEQETKCILENKDREIEGLKAASSQRSEDQHRHLTQEKENARRLEVECHRVTKEKDLLNAVIRTQEENLAKQKHEHEESLSKEKNEHEENLAKQKHEHVESLSKQNNEYEENLVTQNKEYQALLEECNKHKTLYKELGGQFSTLYRHQRRANTIAVEAYSHHETARTRHINSLKAVEAHMHSLEDMDQFIRTEDPGRKQPEKFRLGHLADVQGCHKTLADMNDGDKESETAIAELLKVLGGTATEGTASESTSQCLPSAV